MGGCGRGGKKLLSKTLSKVEGGPYLVFPALLHCFASEFVFDRLPKTQSVNRYRTKLIKSYFIQGRNSSKK